MFHGLDHLGVLTFDHLIETRCGEKACLVSTGEISVLEIASAKS